MTIDEDTPMARACADCASAADFSLILRCFSSSLARIGTRSSGIGLLSYTKGQRVSSSEPNLEHDQHQRTTLTLKLWLNLTRSATRFSISFLTNACFFCVSLCRSLVTKSRKAGRASAGGYMSAVIYMQNKRHGFKRRQILHSPSDTILTHLGCASSSS